MAFEQKEMLGLILARPEEAKRKILGTLKREGVHMGRAAKAIGCAHVTLLRWIDRLGIAKDVERMKAEAIKGKWYKGHRGGRPKGTTVASGRARPRTPKSSDRSDEAPAR